MEANNKGEMDRFWQIVGMAKEIKNVWPGAEKKMPDIEKIKKRGDLISKLK